jgi:hypothetical protein
VKIPSDICPPQRRQAVLAERRRLKMACSAHAYVRGSTLKFYEWLESSIGRSFLDQPFHAFALLAFGTFAKLLEDGSEAIFPNSSAVVPAKNKTPFLSELTGKAVSRR